MSMLFAGMVAGMIIGALVTDYYAQEDQKAWSRQVCDLENRLKECRNRIVELEQEAINDND